MCLLRPLRHFRRLKHWPCSSCINSGVQSNFSSTSRVKRLVSFHPDKLWVDTHTRTDRCRQRQYPSLGQCTLAGPLYTGMPLECHWLTHCKLGYHWATQRILVGYTGTPLEKLSWNSPTLECHWRNLVESAPHWDATGETLTFRAYTGTPLEGLWQPTHAPTHIVKHAE